MFVKRALRDDRTMKALTGLSINKFKELSITFENVLKKEELKKDENSLIKSGRGRKHSLKTPEEKLFFILLYMKCYPTFDLIAFIYNVDRSVACRWVSSFLPLLKKTLEREVVLPKRKINSIEEFTNLFPDVKDIFVDVTERPIQRPKKSKSQRKYYSGKKKRHTIKNTLINDFDKKILYLSPTKSGRYHDKKLFDKDLIGLFIPQTVNCWMDLGYKGSDNDFKNVILPHKKPPKKELSEEQKLENKVIRGLRMVCENAIAGVKRLGIVFDIFRNKKAKLRDQVMELSCGIWNYSLRSY